MTKVALMYGGTSAEHEVSLASAKNVRQALEAATLEVIPILITKQGEWQLEGKQLSSREVMLQLSQFCDVAFPITHGTYGEDGSLQGLMEMLGVPYVGCDVLSSAVCFDKEFSKRILHDQQIAVVDYVCINKTDKPSYQEVSATLGAKLFVKPARQGSSVGITMATNQAEFQQALRVAGEHDTKLLVERAVAGREIEFAVLEENGQVTVSPPGEIVVDDEFYDYDNKYVTDKAKLHVPASLDSQLAEAGRTLAERTFRAHNCRHLARVDCFLEDGQWIVNEVNTLPGFTNISMYPKLFEVSGISQSELVRRLVQAAQESIER